MLPADAQYAANIATMLQQPALHPLIQQMGALPLTNVQVAPGPTGHLVGTTWNVATQACDIPLCDMADPIAAAEQAVAQMWSPQQTVYTMIGLGLGYAVAAFARKLLPYQRLVVWDPEANFFKAMLYALDINTIFQGTRVEIYVGTELLPKVEHWYMSLEVQEKLHMALPVSHAYTSLYRTAEYEAVMTQCMNMLRFHMVGLATWRQFGHCIGNNDLENMPEFYQNPGLSSLKGLWSGQPAVCVAAGPSLQKNLAQLLPAEVRAKVALITVGTTYGLLQGLGLAPDIVTTIDFQALNWTDQFQYIPLDPDCTLVYLHSTAPQTVRRWPGPTFVATNSSDTMAWIQRYAEEDKGAAGQVQTVAHLNLLVALALGANPIILLGQDLSMPATEHHTAGARAQDLAPADVQPEAFMETVDMYGQPVKTRHSFASMLMVFERIIAEHPETTFINASEQGVLIKGAVHMPLAQVLAALPPGAHVGLPHVRPAFQGETVPQLQHRRPSPLRAALKAVHAVYEPKVKDTFPADFQKLCREVEELAQWATKLSAQWDLLEARTLQPHEQAAACSSDVLSDAETVALLNMSLYQEIIASEKMMADRPHATGMYIIRRFDFIELKGEIPPLPGTFTEPWHPLRYAAERLVRAARMFVEEWPVLRALLRHVSYRLQRSPHVTQAMMRQQYRHAGTLLRQLSPATSPDTPMAAHMRALAQLFRHTQQYAAALGLMEAWDNFPTRETHGTQKHAQRIREHLARYQADVRQALQAYFPKSATPAALPLGDTTHAWAVPAGTPEEDKRYVPVTLAESIPVHTNGHVTTPLVLDVLSETAVVGGTADPVQSLK